MPPGSALASRLDTRNVPNCTGEHLAGSACWGGCWISRLGASAQLETQTKTGTPVCVGHRSGCHGNNLYLPASSFIEPSAAVRIVQPSFASTIDRHNVRISGVTSPPDADVIVAVRSESDTRWWLNVVGPEPSARLPNGDWTIEVPIGTAAEGV